MKGKLYKWLQKRKERRASQLGMPLPGGIKPLVKRKYLTREGIKNWDELTLDDKLSLNIDLDSSPIDFHPKRGIVK